MTVDTATTPFPAAARTRGIVYALRNVVAEAKRLEAEGRDILYLNIGDPILFDLRPPTALVKAAGKSLSLVGSRYAPSTGLPEARAAISASLAADGVTVSPDDVILTNGATEAIEMVMTALLEPGDELLVPSPGYPLYGAVAAKIGAACVPYRLNPKAGWAPDMASLEAACGPRSKALLVINPGNPTGAVWNREAVAELTAFAARKGLVVFADEVYRDLVFDETTERLAAIAPRSLPVVGFDSLSKSHLVPGWRCGWMALRHGGELADLRAALGRLADARLSSPAGPQSVVAEALADKRHLPALRRKLKSRVRRVERGLRKIKGFEVVPAGAAFYSLFRVKQTGEGGDAGWCRRLLHETGLLLVPGSGFGRDGSEGWVRMVTTAPPEILDDALARIAKFVGRG